MEFDLDYNKIFCCGNPEDKKAVVPVDCSIILPDYFPDVMKILRYTAKTVKSPVISEAGGETVSGSVSIEVSYVSEEGELCSCSQLQPFSHVFEKTANIAAAEADVTIGEIGCKAVNKRRIDLHGSIDIVLRTVCGEEKSFVSSAKGAETVCNNKDIETISFIGEFYKGFTVEEKDELGYGKPPFGKILRSYAFAHVSECHVIQDKVVTKGEVKVTAVWVPEENENGEKGPFVSVFTYPVSRMVDANGILQSDICDARYEAEFPEISPCDDGQNINIKIKIGIFARVYRKSQINYIEDMFSTKYEMKTEKAKLFAVTEAVPLFIEEPGFEKFDLPESAETVTDLWLEAGCPKIDSEGKIRLPAKLCMFAKDEDENPVYFEKNIEKEFLSKTSTENIVFYNICSGVKNEEFSISGEGKAEISATLLLDGTIYKVSDREAVAACSVDLEKKIEHGSLALTFCYAEKGEKIWDIAKKYSVSLEQLMKENELSEDVLFEKTMLTITR